MADGWIVGWRMDGGMMDDGWMDGWMMGGGWMDGWSELESSLCLHYFMIDCDSLRKTSSLCLISLQVFLPQSWYDCYHIT